MNEQEFIKQAFDSGLNPQQVSQAVQMYRQKQPQGNWLTGTRTSIPGKILEGAGNILSIPSYAIGGMLDEVQQKGVQAFNPLKNPLGIPAAISGIKDKKAVMKELPETFGVDPNSGAGMAIGLTGELLTPGIPIGKAAGAVRSVFRGGKAAKVAKTANVFSRTGAALEEAGARLPLRVLKPSKTQAKVFREATGMTLEEFLQKNPQLIGTGEQSLESVQKIIKPLQKQYNALARSGKPVDAYEFGVALLDKADEIQKGDFSIEAKQVADRMRQQAELFIQQADKTGGNIPIDVVTNTKSTAFGKAGRSLVDPTVLNAQKEVGGVGIDVISKYAPKTKPLGQKLKNYRQFEAIANEQADLGKGNNLFNILTSPGAGAIAGFSQGDTIQDRVRNAAFWFAAGSVVKNPKVIAGSSKGLTTVGKSLQNFGKTGASSTVGKVFSRLPQAVARGTFQSTQSNKVQQEPQVYQPQPKSLQETTPAYKPIIPSAATPDPKKVKPLEYKQPKTIFANKSSFGSTKKVNRGSFY